VNARLSTKRARYATSLCSVAAALGLTLSARPWFESTAYALFLAAVMFSSWFGGLTPGLIVILLSVVSLDRYFSPPGLSHVLSRDDVIHLGIFLLVAGVISHLSRARMRAEQELRTNNQELENRVAARTDDLRNLSRQLLHSQDEERRRTARLLHETVAQDLAALKMELATAKRLGDWHSVEGRASIEEALSLTDECIREARTVSYLLHPPLLDEAGLTSALQWYVAGFDKRSGIKTRLELPAKFGRLPRETETTVFRFVQECLTNVHRHSGSLAAHVQIQQSETELTVTVGDEGRGMHGDQFGVGIMGLHERLRQAGGSMKIQSDHRGTILKAVLPREGVNACHAHTS
jgi:signal transduction histidine kinase